MKTLTKILMTIDFLLIVTLVTLQIGCITASNLHNPVESNVVVAPTTVVTNTVNGQTGGSTFNTEDYVWDSWRLRGKEPNDGK